MQQPASRHLFLIMIRARVNRMLLVRPGLDLLADSAACKTACYLVLLPLSGSWAKLSSSRLV